MNESKKTEMRDAVRRVAMSFELEDILRRYKKRNQEAPNQEKTLAKLNAILSRQMNSHQVRVSGNNATSSEFVVSELDLSTPNSIETCSTNLLDGLNRMQRDLDIFEYARAEIDIDSEDDRQLNVDVSIKEKSRLTAKIGASHSLGNSSADAPMHGDMSVGVRNLFGRGESLEIGSNVGLSGRTAGSRPNGGAGGTTTSLQNVVDNTSIEYSIVFKKPRVDLGVDLFPYVQYLRTPEEAARADLTNEPTKPYLIAKGFREHLDRCESSSYHKETVGATVGLISPNLEHSYQLKYHLRSQVIDRRTDGSPDAMAGTVSDYQAPSVKSSIEYNFMRDRRDHIALPTEGYQASANVELAGLGADVDFLKILGRFQRHWKLVTQDFGNFVFNVGAESGLVLPWKKSLFGGFGDPYVRAIDRLVPLAGLQMRGFQYGQIGPRERGDYVHTDFLFNIGASLTFAILPSYLLYANVFCNAIHCGLLKDTSMANVANNARISTGVSLIIPTPVARIEAGYAIPQLSRTHGDTFSSFFFQFGTNFF